jgi:hypothetical protein
VVRFQNLIFFDHGALVLVSTIRSADSWLETMRLNPELVVDDSAAGALDLGVEALTVERERGKVRPVSPHRQSLAAG